jgi:hypothetical protein
MTRLPGVVLPTTAPASQEVAASRIANSTAEPAPSPIAAPATSAATAVTPSRTKVCVPLSTVGSGAEPPAPAAEACPTLECARVADRGPVGRLASRIAASRLTPSGLTESDLLCLQRGVPERGNSDELVALPLAGLAEVEVERLSCRGNHCAVG